MESFNSITEVPDHFADAGKEELATVRTAWAESLGRDESQISGRDASAIDEWTAAKGAPWCLEAIGHNKTRPAKEKAATARQAFFFYDQHCREGPDERDKLGQALADRIYGKKEKA